MNLQHIMLSEEKLIQKSHTVWLYLYNGLEMTKLRFVNVENKLVIAGSQGGSGYVWEESGCDYKRTT